MGLDAAVDGNRAVACPCVGCRHCRARYSDQVADSGVLTPGNIRPDAALELDRLVALMKKYPTLEVLAETYADTRGLDSYNLALTDERANSIIEYAVSQGIESSRLKAAGRGEANPIVDCNSKKCTAAEYELSRRSEFSITKR